MVWNLPPANASSHREAPLISADPLADNTDLYAFVSPDKPDTVTIIANWIPFEEPAGGPNFNSFGDDVRYEIYVDNNGDAKADIGYWFRFTTHVRNPNTFLYNVGPIKSLDDPNWNVYQTYTITRVTPTGSTVIGENLATPPVNIGPKSTPNYDALAAAAVHTLSTGAKVFAGQRDDPFFVDLGSVFDLLTIRKLPGNQGGGKDDLKGYNCHTIALQIPINLLTKDGSMPKEPKDGAAVIGVWTTSSRKELKVLNAPGEPPTTEGDWVQVSRLGMPLVNEVVVPLGAKDLWNASKPEDDAQFLAGVTDPEPARLLKLLYNINVPPTPRDDLVAIFLTGIPGLTQPPNVKPSEQLRLNVAIPPSAKPHPLGVVGGDLAGFPNGRRLADDTTDIELKAVAGAVYPLFHPDFKADPVAGLLGDGVDGNDLPFLSSFPYVGSPHQGLEHAHDPTQMNYHFLAVSSAGTIDGVNHLIVMDGNGKFNVGLSQIDGGGSFLHFDGASKVPQTALGYGTWRPKRLVSYNQIGMWGPVGAGILEVEIELIPEFSASSPTLSVIPATLKVICNIGAAGISTGLDEGFILSIPDAKLEFKPLTPHLGLTAFIAGVEEGEARGQTNFHFLARSKAATIEGVDHRVLMSGNGKITPSQVVGGGTFVHFDQASKVPKKIIGAGTWKAKRLISFKPIGTAGPYTAGTVEMEIDIFAVSGTNVSAPTVIPATLKVNCNLDPAGITTGQPEGFTVNVPSVKLEFKPIEPADGLTVFSKGPVEEADNVFFLQLDAGLNMISLPLQPAKAHTAKSLIRELGATILA
ncbi:DUF4331 domain-containing protein [Candidatus Poribacteria bacterium]|nr:DUF4331 domain-containing protein [Candidatus Poribacteria bacterium]